MSSRKLKFWTDMDVNWNLPGCKKCVFLFSYVAVYPSRRNFNQKKEYTYTTMHWHHNAVSSLCFTPEGTRMWLFPPFQSDLVISIRNLLNITFIYPSFKKIFLLGTNLLSGGVESVLVQWRYKQESERDFLPRLGSAITHIAVSPDGTLFCTSHSDNSKTPSRCNTVLRNDAIVVMENLDKSWHLLIGYFQAWKSYGNVLYSFTCAF